MKRWIFCTFFCAPVFAANCQQFPRPVFPDARVTAIVFLALDCPISQKYIPTLNRVHQAYKDRAVRIQSVIPGKIKKRALRKFTSAYGILFGVKGDKKYAWARALTATTTPQVFVFDEDGRLKYQGAIDNWFYELGGYRKEPTENYLTDAIDALLAGGLPRVEKTRALGCFIQMPL